MLDTSCLIWSGTDLWVLGLPSRGAHWWCVQFYNRKAKAEQEPLLAVYVYLITYLPAPLSIVTKQEVLRKNVHKQ